MRDTPFLECFNVGGQSTTFIFTILLSNYCCIDVSASEKPSKHHKYHSCNGNNSPDATTWGEGWIRCYDLGSAKRKLLLFELRAAFIQSTVFVAFEMQQTVEWGCYQSEHQSHKICQPNCPHFDSGIRVFVSS